MNRSCLVALCLVLLFCATGRLVLADDAEAIRASSKAFVTAFDKGDAKAVADLWTADGVLIDESGTAYRGRPAIEATYAKFFAAHPDVKINVSVDSIRLLTGDAALEEGSATLESAPDAGATAAKYSAVHVKKDDAWRMAFVRESGFETPPADSASEDLDWLVGKWSAEEYGVTTKVDCRWLPNKSFLERTFSVTTPKDRKISGLQLIGVNPRTGRIMSWNFNFDGSHAVGAWTPQAHGWAINTLGVQPDGTETHAVNLFRKLDDNAFSWQSIQRSIGDRRLPDTPEVILRRVVPTKPRSRRRSSQSRRSSFATRSNSFPK